MRNRWGKGTTYEKVVDTEKSDEFKNKLAELQAARDKQDTMWEVPLTCKDEQHSGQPTSLSGTNPHVPSSQRKVAGNP
jgi:hypothetical protein